MPFCYRCKGAMVTCDMSTCRICGGDVASGSYSLCENCSTQLNECQICCSPTNVPKPADTKETFIMGINMDHFAGKSFTVVSTEMKEAIVGKLRENNLSANEVVFTRDFEFISAICFICSSSVVAFVQNLPGIKYIERG
eukprot:TRINITY_DN16494_c0_g1_i1.p2 TRINITY_DN16494_c0_g1~~TRINITY_DN16494_c0_g1_i1.p2  ORF type:complete len:139 (-),score=11.59 TRINITY_DN16494_c0_g1_i1:47-463(-)